MNIHPSEHPACHDLVMALLKMLGFSLWKITLPEPHVDLQHLFAFNIQTPHACLVSAAFSILGSL